MKSFLSRVKPVGLINAPYVQHLFKAATVKVPQCMLRKMQRFVELRIITMKFLTAHMAAWLKRLPLQLRTRVCSESNQ